jgi:hypothetical protein
MRLEATVPGMQNNAKFERKPLVIFRTWRNLPPLGYNDSPFFTASTRTCPLMLKMATAFAYGSMAKTCATVMLPGSCGTTRGSSF